MTAKRWIVLAVLAAAGSGWWWMQRPVPLVNVPPPRGPIVAYGDSLTYGTGAPPEQSYVAQLSRLIGRPVINSGMPGDTIEAAAGRLQRDVLDHRPAMVIVLLGGNDLLRQDNMDEAFARLEEVVRRIQREGAMVVLVGLQGISPIGGIAGRYKALAKKTGALLVPDILDGIFGNPPRMSDQIHPNAEGYRIMAERVAGAIRPWLPPQ